MSRDTRDARAIEEIPCPHCHAPQGRPCRWAGKPRDGHLACCHERRQANQKRLRWFIPDGAAAAANTSVVGAKLLESLRESGQVLYVSPDGGKTLRRVGLAAAAAAERIATEEREPIILTPEEFAQHWRQAGRGGAKTRTAGGAR
jgi:hypothetical protein